MPAKSGGSLFIRYLHLHGAEPYCTSHYYNDNKMQLGAKAMVSRERGERRREEVASARVGCERHQRLARILSMTLEHPVHGAGSRCEVVKSGMFRGEARAKAAAQRRDGEDVLASERGLFPLKDVRQDNQWSRQLGSEGLLEKIKIDIRYEILMTLLDIKDKKI